MDPSPPRGSRQRNRSPPTGSVTPFDLDKIARDAKQLHQRRRGLGGVRRPSLVLPNLPPLCTDMNVLNRGALMSPPTPVSSLPYSLSGNAFPSDLGLRPIRSGFFPPGTAGLRRASRAPTLAVSEPPVLEEVPPASQPEYISTRTPAGNSRFLTQRTVDKTTGKTIHARDGLHTVTTPPSPHRLREELSKGFDASVAAPAPVTNVVASDGATSGTTPGSTRSRTGTGKDGIPRSKDAASSGSEHAAASGFRVPRSPPKNSSLSRRRQVERERLGTSRSRGVVEVDEEVEDEVDVDDDDDGAFVLEESDDENEDSGSDDSDSGDGDDDQRSRKKKRNKKKKKGSKRKKKKKRKRKKKRSKKKKKKDGDSSSESPTLASFARPRTRSMAKKISKIERGEALSDEESDEDDSQSPILEEYEGLVAGKGPPPPGFVPQKRIARKSSSRRSGGRRGAATATTTASRAPPKKEPSSSERRRRQSDEWGSPPARPHRRSTPTPVGRNSRARGRGGTQQLQALQLPDEMPEADFVIKPARRPSSCFLPDIPCKAYSHPYKYDIQVTVPVKFSDDYSVRFRLRVEKSNEYVLLNHRKKQAIRIEKKALTRSSNEMFDVHTYRVVFQVCSFHYQRSCFILEMYLVPTQWIEIVEREDDDGEMMSPFFREISSSRFRVSTRRSRRRSPLNMRQKSDVARRLRDQPPVYCSSPFEMFARKNKKSDKEWPDEEEARVLLEKHELRLKRREKKKRERRAQLARVRSVRKDRGNASRSSRSSSSSSSSLSSRRGDRTAIARDMFLRSKGGNRNPRSARRPEILRTETDEDTEYHPTETPRSESDDPKSEDEVSARARRRARRRSGRRRVEPEEGAEEDSAEEEPIVGRKRKRSRSRRETEDDAIPKKRRRMSSSSDASVADASVSSRRRRRRRGRGAAAAAGGGGGELSRSSSRPLSATSSASSASANRRSYGRRPPSGPAAAAADVAPPLPGTLSLPETYARRDQRRPPPQPYYPPYPPGGAGAGAGGGGGGGGYVPPSSSRPSSHHRHQRQQRGGYREVQQPPTHPQHQHHSRRDHGGGYGSQPPHPHGGGGGGGGGGYAQDQQRYGSTPSYRGGGGGPNHPAGYPGGGGGAPVYRDPRYPPAGGRAPPRGYPPSAPRPPYRGRN